ncbi:hypothetical protein BROUX41_000021 [Berkeleyomyces rouxiae]|uniref:uncharacterized protein n=1 Tax=Berkeleyomyces rouxiae TaxID=2035830 RepID=UPI003B7E5083
MRRRRKLFASSSSRPAAATADFEALPRRPAAEKLDVTSGVFIPVCLNILSILMFLRFGVIVGQVGLLGIVGFLFLAYGMNLLTALSLSAIASNGEVKGGGAYYLISRSLGPEFGGSLGLLFFVSQVLNTSLNIVGLLDCIRLNFGDSLPDGYWLNYGFETVALLLCVGLCLAGSSAFTKANNVMLLVLIISVVSIPLSAIFKTPFVDKELGVEFTGVRLSTLSTNLLPHFSNGHYNGLETFRELFGILFPATSGIFAGASMSGYLRNPSHSIPKGTLWAMLSTLVCYLIVIIAMASSITHESLLRNFNVILLTNLSSKVVIAGECVVTLFSALMGLLAAANLLRALARDKLLPGMEPIFSRYTKKDDDPALFLITYALAQLALFADLNQIATLISMGYHMTFLIMNLACFLLKVGAAPNFRPGFKFFSWQTAAAGAVCSAFTMFFINETYASVAVLLLVLLFSLLHYLSPPKRWGDVSQNLIYHQVRKYLLRLQPEHIKFWRPHILLLVNNPRSQAPLIQFCNSLKKGSLYILGHVIVTDDFDVGVHEAKIQQMAWTKYITELTRLKAFVQLTVSPSLTWGIRNLVLSAGLGGMKPNIAILGFYKPDGDECLKSNHNRPLPANPLDLVGRRNTVPITPSTTPEPQCPSRSQTDGDFKALRSVLPTDHMRVEGSMKATEYMTILEDLALRCKINVAVGKGFEGLEIPQNDDKCRNNKYIDLWPIQISADVTDHDRSIHTTNFDTYTLILQLGYILQSVPNWKAAYKLRVMVFVEYENEVDKEHIRVRELLEKLRINAEVHVFWLANGGLGMYNLLVNGVSNNATVKQKVQVALRQDEWWQNVQLYRGLQHLGIPTPSERDLIGGLAGCRRSSMSSGSTPALAMDTVERLRRHSVTELFSKPTISKLERLGAAVGIHTNHLTSEVFDDNDSAYSDIGSNADFSDYEMDEDGNMDAKTRDEPLYRTSKDLCRPLLPKSSTSLFKTNSSNRPNWRTPLGQKRLGYHSSGQNQEAEASTARCYGSFSAFTSLAQMPRPVPLRQNSTVRFSSKLMPETLTNVDAESNMGRSIMFVEAGSPVADAASAKPEPNQPLVSRQALAPKKKNKKQAQATLASASPGAPGSKHAEASLNPAARDGDLGRASSPSAMGGTGGSSYSTQHINLSFNDLPSRAQHLILNELMVKESSLDAAVVLSTLPIPVEGTSGNEAASLAYLQDIQVLCEDLPPTLLVLSNHMTVTVEL